MLFIEKPGKAENKKLIFQRGYKAVQFSKLRTFKSINLNISLEQEMKIFKSLNFF